MNQTKNALIVERVGTFERTVYMKANSSRTTCHILGWDVHEHYWVLTNLIDYYEYKTLTARKTH